MNMRDYHTLHLEQIKASEQVVIGNNIDVNQHGGLPNITLRHKLKQRNRL